MVENPLLEEVPTEDLQPAEAAAPEKPEADPRRQKTDTWDDQDYEYFFGDYLDDGYRPRAPQEVKELPPIENTLSTSTSLSDHLLWQLSLQTDDDAAARDRRRPSSATSTTTGTWWRRSTRSRRWGTGPVADVERALAARPELRPDRRRRARPAGVPLAAAAAPRPRGHADREDRHRAPAPAAEPPGAGARAQAGPPDRGAQAAHRDHPAPRPEAGQPLQPARSRSTSSRTCTS